MPKLIPTIYFYVLSLIGFVLLLIGIFASIHYVVNVTQFASYPLGYDATQRCAPAAQPQPVKAVGNMIIPAPSMQQSSWYQACLAGVESERKQLQTKDLEKAVSFTLIGLLVFGIHFYYARKKFA